MHGKTLSRSRAGQQLHTSLQEGVRGQTSQPGGTLSNLPAAGVVAIALPHLPASQGSCCSPCPCAGRCFQFLWCIAGLCGCSCFSPSHMNCSEQGERQEAKIEGSKEPVVYLLAFSSLSKPEFLSVSEPKCALAPLPNTDVPLAVRNKTSPSLQGDFFSSKRTAPCSAGSCSAGWHPLGGFSSPALAARLPQNCLGTGEVKLLPDPCHPRGAALRSVWAHGTGHGQHMGHSTSPA